MTFILDVLPAALGGTAAASTAAAGTAAAGTAAAATTTAAAAGVAGTGLSWSSILTGVATVGGIVASIAAGNTEAEQLKMQAKDAEAEKGFETVQSVDRKRSLLKAAADTVGEIDTAYAGSGVDLSFGSAAQARKEVYREADLGLTTDSATTAMRIDRLTERARNYRSLAKRAKALGLIKGFTGGLEGFASLQQQA